MITIKQCVGFMALMFMISNISTSWANTLPVFRLLTGEKLNRVTDNNTFWKKYNLDRLYFSPDNSFVQQLNNPEGSIAPGTILTGTWNVNNDNLCWKYSEKEIEKSLNIANIEFCYAVYSDAADDTFMTLHNERFRLYKITNGAQDISPSFKWDRWAYDNYILDPEYVPIAQKALDTMSTYKNSFFIPGGTIKREDLNERMKLYYDEVIGKVFFVGDNLMYMHPSGVYFSTSEQLINEYKRNVDLLATPDRFGFWTIKNNTHCYGRSESSSASCQFIFPVGKGLIRPYEGILSMHRNGFTRVHGEMSVGNIDASETSLPELFQRVDQIISTRQQAK